jgi:hypothetical protein
MRERRDFIQVRLSAAGRVHSGGALRIATQHWQYAFADDKPVEVLRVPEWTVMRLECDAEGVALFEEAVGDTTAENVQPAETLQAVKEIPAASEDAAKGEES